MARSNVDELTIAATAARMLASGRALAKTVEGRAPERRVEVDTPQTRRWALATSRRDAVRRMSLDDKPVAEIAAATGLRYSSVVKMRGVMGVGRCR